MGLFCEWAVDTGGITEVLNCDQHMLTESSSNAVRAGGAAPANLEPFGAVAHTLASVAIRGGDYRCPDYVECLRGDSLRSNLHGNKFWMTSNCVTEASEIYCMEGSTCTTEHPPNPTFTGPFWTVILEQTGTPPSLDPHPSEALQHCITPWERMGVGDPRCTPHPSAQAGSTDPKHWTPHPSHKLVKVDNICEVKEEGNTDGPHRSRVWEVSDSPPLVNSQEADRPPRSSDAGVADIITINMEEDKSDSLCSADDVKQASVDADSHQELLHHHQQGGAAPSDGGELTPGVSALQQDWWDIFGAPKQKPRGSSFELERDPQERNPSPAEEGPGCVSLTVKVEGGALKQEEEGPQVCRMLSVPVLSECREESNRIPPTGVPHMDMPDKILPAALPHLGSPEDLPTPVPHPAEHSLCLAGGNPSSASLTVSGTAPTAEERPFACMHCGKIFSQQRNLRDHQRYHTGKKTHRCAHCGKGFVYRCHLKVHLQSHTGERPHSCAQCGKTFTYLCNLKSHLQYHSGEKPFSCAQCGKSFRNPSHLKKHRFVHSGERPFRCSHCGKRFATNGDLKRHQRVHTRESVTAPQLR
ncbi:hypothetical protein GJAV_G00156180 [Gymnothorax javanicus]|nr:hypothetical protein GJAV_G00156180 [Gymnothorax javanicus]